MKFMQIRFSVPKETYGYLKNYVGFDQIDEYLLELIQKDRNNRK